MLFMGNVNKDDIMLLNIIYHNSNKNNDYVDSIDIIYKDLKTGEKHIKHIDNPEIDIYFTKEEYQDYDYNKAFIEIDKTEKHRCKYKDLPFYIAKKAGGKYEQYVKNMIEQKNFGAIQNIHKYPFVFGSDYDIENWYRIQWILNYDNEKPKKLTKTYMDIEVNTSKVTGFPKPEICPIDAATLIDEESKSVFTFLLDTGDNPQITEFKKSIDSFITELHQAFDESYGEFNYYIYMFDDEKDLIIQLFKLINTLKRDFNLTWNGYGFDIPYIINRIRALGMNPEDIMCHKDFPYKEVIFKKDTKNFSVTTKSDLFKISSYTVFMDQMVNYACVRKSGSELRSYALNTIAEAEIGDTKLDYSEVSDLKSLPMKDYRKYVLYNIKDVFLQYGVERKTCDLDSIYYRAYSNATQYHKVFKQTVFLKNRAYLEYYKQGFIIGNNINVHYGVNDDEESKSKKEKFSGALVADPELNDHTGIKMFGSRSKYIFDNVVDMDFSSMYPHIIITFNIAPNCMVGKLLIDNDMGKIIKDLNEGDIKYDAGQDFIDNYLTNNIPLMGSKWFNLTKTQKLDELIRKKFKINKKKKINFSENNGKLFFIEGEEINI